MKKILSKWFIVLAIFIIRVTYSQSNVKVWIETTVQDFSDNQLTNVVVTNNSGGEVQLPHPLKITVQDHRDDSVFRFISKDSAGNYVGAWIQDGNIFVKKYSSSGNELTGAIQVNDVNASLTSYSIYRTALFNDGTCIVIWNTKNLYGQIFE
jgi:hypothetical protein